MTDTSLSQGADNATDIAASLRTSDPLQVFIVSMGRVERLLKAGRSGIDSDVEMAGGLLGKLGTFEKDFDHGSHELVVAAKADTSEGKEISLELTQREVGILKDVINHELDFLDSLPFYLHNILCVYAWSAFEGYMQASLLRAFMSRPDLIVSERQLKVVDVVKARNDIVAYVVSGEIDEVGRRSFNELQKYLGARFKLCFGAGHADEMNGFYFVRNVISHTGGTIRTDQLSQVPDNVAVSGDELRISADYVKGMIDTLKSAVTWFDAKLSERLATLASA